jgi:orotate phosphoribosyltransferase
VLLRALVEVRVPLVPAVDALARLELGGVPIVTILSQPTGLPALFVRKRAKDHDTCRLAGGGEVSGRRLVIVEDVVSTGGPIIEATRELRKRGAESGAALCVIDRENGGPSNL